MPSGEHTHVMNAHQPNPRAGLKKDDGSAEPSHIPHAEPARASQEDYRCIYCGKTHDELIPVNDPSRKGKAVEVKSESKAASKPRKSAPKKPAVAAKEPAKANG